LDISFAFLPIFGCEIKRLWGGIRREPFGCSSQRHGLSRYLRTSLGVHTYRLRSSKTAAGCYRIFIGSPYCFSAIL